MRLAVAGTIDMREMEWMQMPNNANRECKYFNLIFCCHGGGGGGHRIQFGCELLTFDLYFMRRFVFVVPFFSQQRREAMARCSFQGLAMMVFCLPIVTVFNGVGARCDNSCWKQLDDVGQRERRIHHCVWVWRAWWKICGTKAHVYCLPHQYSHAAEVRHGKCDARDGKNEGKNEKWKMKINMHVTWEIETQNHARDMEEIFSKFRDFDSRNQCVRVQNVYEHCVWALQSTSLLTSLPNDSRTHSPTSPSTCDLHALNISPVFHFAVLRTSP